MKIGRLLAGDPRCKDFVEMLKDYGLLVKRDAIEKFLMDAERIEDKSPRAINDRREYYRQVYLKTDHWRSLKIEKLGVIRHCEFCLTSSNLDVHHRRYRDLYNVKLGDLAVLCRKCHDELHASIPSNLRGLEKEEALDQIYVARRKKVCRANSSEREKFHEVLKRMISIASKIRKAHGIVLAGKIRPLFRPVLASENRKLQRFFLQME